MRFFFFPLLFCVTACQQNMEAVRRTSISARDNLIETKDHIGSYFILPPYEKPQNQPVASRYCYKTLADIICYADPQPSMESRLVASQGVATSHELPASTSLPPVAASGQDMKRERQARAQPVFVGLPPVVRSDDSTVDLEAIGAKNQVQGQLY